MLVAPQNSYIEILTPKVIVLAGGDFGSWVGHEDWAFTNGISAFIKEAWESWFALLPFEIMAKDSHLGGGPR